MMDQCDLEREIEELNNLAQMAWELAIDDNLDAAVELLENVKNNHNCLRMYEVQHSIYETAYVLSKRKIFHAKSIQTIFGRLIHGMENSRLFLDIGDCLRDYKNIEMAVEYYKKAQLCISSSTPQDWRDEIESRLREYVKLSIGQ